MTSYDVRQVDASEIVLLTEVLGSPQLIDDRFCRQEAGKGKLFAAWEEDRPAGMVFLWLCEAEEPEIRKNLPDVALLMNLEVVPRLRNLGIGRSLIGEVENELRRLGQDRVALAVRKENEDAIRLYERLRFAEWGLSDVICYGQIHQEDGSVTLYEEHCHVMVKTLESIEEEPATEDAGQIVSGRAA